jgi:hypothetical protein
MEIGKFAEHLCRGNAKTRLGQEWPEEGESMVGVPRLLNIRKLLGIVVRNEVPGDFLEAGVWRGGASIYARRVLNDLGANGRKVWVCDSFQGLPKASHPEDWIDYHGLTQLEVPLEEVEGNFAKYGLLENVEFVKGWFKDTLPTIAPKITLAVLRLDGDMWESTIDTLVPLYPRVSRGGFVIVDDYNLAPCARAVDHFRSSKHIRGSLTWIDPSSVYWQV